MFTIPLTRPGNPEMRLGGPGSHSQPAWAPDNRTIATTCRKPTDQFTQICLTDKQYPIPNTKYASSPSWLPSGRELAVVTYTQPSVAQVIASNGSYRQTIPGTSGAVDVSVSRDGQRVAFIRYDGDATSPGTGTTPKRSLRLVPVTGGTAKVLAGGGGYHDRPEWSPDGRSIHYTRADRQADGTLGNRDAYSVPVAGGTPTRLIPATTLVDEESVAMHDSVFRPQPSPAPLPLADFDGNGRPDVAVFRPNTGAWIRSGHATVIFGQLGDVPVPADYNGDRRAEIAVYRPSTGTWYIRNVGTFKWGQPGDVAVPADYNGDGRTDIAVFRPSNGTWYVRNGSAIQFGRAGDVPVPGNWTGDRRAELAVARGTAWLVRNAVLGRWNGTDQQTELLAPGDYDADGYVDRGSVDLDYGKWYTDNPTYRDGYGAYASFPTPWAAVPVAGNWTGDRWTEIGLFIPADGTWLREGLSAIKFGVRGDVPV